MIARIFGLLQTVQIIIGVQRFACQFIFLNPLTVAIIAVGILRQQFIWRGYCQAGDVLISIIDNILPHSIGMGNLIYCAIDITVKSDY